MGKGCEKDEMRSREREKRKRGIERERGAEMIDDIFELERQMRQ